MGAGNCLLLASEIASLLVLHADRVVMAASAPEACRNERREILCVMRAPYVRRGRYGMYRVESNGGVERVVQRRLGLVVPARPAKIPDVCSPSVPGHALIATKVRHDISIWARDV